MDRSRFYASVRRRASGVFGTSLSQGQVDGTEAILNEALKRRTPVNDLAYILGTVYHETAHTMQPITEYGQRSYFDKYEPGTRIGKVLGNTLRGDGFRYRGRGHVMITGRANYAKASRKLGLDLVANPDLALKPEISVRILFEGMNAGWFTGRDLDDFIDDIDEADAEDLREFIGARRVVNGTDKAEKIGRYALAFEKALKAAGYAPKVKQPPKPAPAPSRPTKSKSPLAALVAAAAIAIIGAAFAFAKSQGWI